MKTTIVRLLKSEENYSKDGVDLLIPYLGFVKMQKRAISLLFSHPGHSR